MTEDIRPLTAREEDQIRGWLARETERIGPMQVGFRAGLSWTLAARLLASLDAARAATPWNHRLLMPPHPGDVFAASALCSCGEWQFDSGSFEALVREYGLILREHTRHASAPTEAIELPTERADGKFDAASDLPGSY